MENDLRMITKQTGVQMGLVVSTVAGISGVIWWASAMTTKMDTVISQLTSIQAGANQQAQATDQLRARVEKIEFLGSPKLIELDRKVTEIEKRFDAHIAKP